MSEEYGPDFITLTDEDGNEFELEFVDSLEHNGQLYMAFFPADDGESTPEEEEEGLIILKSIMVDGEEQLSTLESEEELEEVYDRFMEAFFQDDDEDEEEK